MRIPFLGGDDHLQEEIATHSGILAWKIPQTGAWRAKIPTGLKNQTRLSIQGTRPHTSTHTHTQRSRNLRP